MKIIDIANINTEKIETSVLTRNTYISTENMMSNCGGVEVASSIPTGKVTSFCKDDTLISNIRPYFKKVWYARYNGGCSNDVICVRTKSEVCLPAYLYYALCTDKFIDIFSASSKGTKMPRGDKNALLSYDIPDRTITEQQHIVDILGSIDEKIEQNEQIIGELEKLMATKYLELVSGDCITLKISDYVNVLTGKLDANAAVPNGIYPFFTCGITSEQIDYYAFDCEAIIIAGNGNFNVKYYNGKFNAYQRTYVITATDYFHIIIQHYKNKVAEWTGSAKGSVIKFLTKSMLTDDEFQISSDKNRNNAYSMFCSASQEKIKHVQLLNAKLQELKAFYLKKFFC